MSDEIMKEVAASALGELAEVLKMLGVDDGEASVTPHHAELAREAYAARMRDARAKALEEAAKKADAQTCGDQDTHADCSDPGQCEAAHSLASDIRALKVQP